MNLQRYYNLLDATDWYYTYSDDPKVQDRGRDQFARLKSIARESHWHECLYVAFCRHFYSGKPWGTPQQPKPERPS